MDMEQLKTMSGEATNRLRTEQVAIETGFSADEPAAPETPVVDVTAKPTPEPIGTGKKVKAPEKAAKAPKEEKTYLEKVEAIASAPEESPKKDIPVVPTYTPDFKYKAGKEEKEIPEYLRAALKDADTEKQVKEILEKADGIEYIKGKHQELYNQFSEVTQQHKLVNQGLAEVGDLVRKKDFDGFFEAVQINPQEIYDWVLKKAQEQQLPPEQKAALDARREAERRAKNLEVANTDFGQQLTEQANRTRRLEVDLVTQRPDVRSFADQFNERMGNPDAFKAELWKYGKWVWDTEKRDIPADEAAGKIMEHFGRLMGITAEAPVMGSGASASPMSTKKPPTIPNIAGGSTSPTKAPVKNFDELKKISKQAASRVEVRNG